MTKILELSGIGDATFLSLLGIDIVVDNLDVGEHLQTGLICIVALETVDNGEPGHGTIDGIAQRDQAALGVPCRPTAQSSAPPFSEANIDALAHNPLLRHRLRDSERSTSGKPCALLRIGNW